MHIIVGVDPGTTVAVAAFGLDGKFLGAWSGRDAGKEEAIKHINSIGTPVLLATDVSTTPDLLAKLAADYNVRVFSPSQSLGSREKLELARGFDCGNGHELDAIAAARRAYRAYENKFRLIDRVMAERGESGKADAVKQLVVRGLSVHRALIFLEPKPEAVPSGAAQHVHFTKAVAGDERIRNELKAALSSIMELRRALDRVEAERGALAEKLAEHERGLAARLRENSEIRRLQRRIAALEDIISRMRGGKKQKADPQEKKSLKQPADKEESVDVDSILSVYRQSR